MMLNWADPRNSPARSTVTVVCQVHASGIFKVPEYSPFPFEASTASEFIGGMEPMAGMETLTRTEASWTGDPRTSATLTQTELSPTLAGEGSVRSWI